MKNILFISSLFLLFLSGCGNKSGIVTSSQKSYIYFIGKTSDVVVSVDKGSKFNIENGQKNQYAMKPGKHLIEIYRNGSIVVKREIFLGDGISKEIEVK